MSILVAGNTRDTSRKSSKSHDRISCTTAQAAQIQQEIIFWRQDRRAYTCKNDHIPLCVDRAFLVTGGREELSDESSDIGSQPLSSPSASAHVELGERVSEYFVSTDHSTDMSTGKCVLFIHTLNLHRYYFALTTMINAGGFPSEIFATLLWYHTNHPETYHRSKRKLRTFATHAHILNDTKHLIMAISSYLCLTPTPFTIVHSKCGVPCSPALPLTVILARSTIWKHVESR